ncbi:MAG: MarR family winged helix-turn-helix transcriptional regulator [Micrococcaceae bacterium]|nr:MarR family winged helix-turn-helix transcriptional regulator [Micrococcaceae bacterium]
MTPFSSDPRTTPDTTSDGLPLESLVLDVEHEFSRIAVTARQGIRKKATSIHPDLQPLGYNVLSVLVREHAQQQISLAEELQVDKATMSRTIKWLEAQQLVTRVPDPHDGRAMLVSVTDVARAGFLASSAASRQRLRNRLASWDAGEIRHFADLLSKLNDSDSP